MLNIAKIYMTCIVINKLICDLNDKNKYVAHIKLLKQALNHGLVLKKVHRVISFNQEAWMNNYIITNIEE